MIKPMSVTATSLLFLVAGLSGCSHYYLPASRLDTPEALGPGYRGRFEALGIQTGADFVATPTQGSPPEGSTTLPNPKLQMTFGPLFGAGLRLGDRTDLSLRLQPMAPVAAHVKQQLSGLPEGQAKRGDFALGVAAGGGILLGSDGGVSVNYLSLDGALLMGYRIWEHHLFMLNPFYRMGNLSGPASYAANASQVGASLGYQYDISDVLIRFELAYGAGTAGANDLPTLFPAAQLAFRF